MTTKGLVAALLTVLLCSPLPASELRILAWNVESGSPSANDHANGADPDTITEEIGDFEGYDIIALTEVSPGDADDYIEACGEGESGSFEGHRSDTGGGDRQVIAYNADRFQLMDGPEEAHDHNGLPLNFQSSSGNWRFRSPMYVVLREASTGIEFIFMVIHLARGSSAHENTIQATSLRAWALAQNKPVIIAGDANFDFNH